MILFYDFKQKKFINTEHPDYTRAKIFVQENGCYFEYIRWYFTPFFISNAEFLLSICFFNNQLWEYL
jgi:hypothetical protein